MDDHKRAALAFHREILSVWVKAAKVAWGAVAENVPIEEAYESLQEFHKDIAHLPNETASHQDMRFMPFRKARLAVKSATESALIIEPAFRDPGMRQIEYYASHHDAALQIAMDIAGVLEDAFGEMKPTDRLSLRDMVFNSHKLEADSLGLAALYWLRLHDVYDEYRAALLSEAAYLFQIADLPETYANTSVASPSGQWKAPRATPPICKCGKVMIANSGPRINREKRLATRYFKCRDCGTTDFIEQDLVRADMA